MFRFNFFTRKRDAKIKWIYNYPVVDGEVQNAALSRFQSGIINLKDTSPGKACNDFLRHYQINGRTYHPGTNHETILSDIDHLVDSCDGYRNEATERKLLSDWIKSRGGQDHNFFIQELVRSNHFISERHIGIGAPDQVMISADWVQNPEGKLQLNYSANILSLLVKCSGENRSEYLVVANEQEDDQLDFYQSNTTDLQTYGERKQNELSPLLRISASIQLDVVNGSVLPSFKTLQVISYNESVQMNIMRHINYHDIRSLKILEILNLLKSILMSTKEMTSARNVLEYLVRLVEMSRLGADMHAIIRAYQIIVEINTSASDSLELLGFIADKLQHLIQSFNPHGSYTYTAIDGYEHELIKEWKEYLIDLPTSKADAYEDLRRFGAINDCYFDGNCDITEVKDAIIDLPRVARYQSEDDRQALVDWLSNKPITSHALIFDQMCDNGLIMLSSQHIKPKKVSIASAEWHVTHDGNIALTYSMYIYSFYCKEMQLYAHKVADNSRVNYSEIDRDFNVQIDSPLMRISLNIQLSAMDGKVTPQLRSLEAESYTPEISMLSLDKALQKSPDFESTPSLGR